MPFYAFPADVRRVLYTTNAIEALNAKLRSAVRTRGHFPTDEAALKLLFLVLNRTEREWKMPPASGPWPRPSSPSCSASASPGPWPDHVVQPPDAHGNPDTPRASPSPPLPRRRRSRSRPPRRRIATDPRSAAPSAGRTACAGASAAGAAAARSAPPGHRARRPRRPARPGRQQQRAQRRRIIGQ